MLRALKGVYENGKVYFEEDVDITKAEVVVVFLANEERNMELKLNAEEDPILKFIGNVSHGFLAKEIDQTLYEK